MNRLVYGVRVLFNLQLFLEQLIVGWRSLFRQQAAVVLFGHTHYSNTSFSLCKVGFIVIVADGLSRFKLSRCYFTFTYNASSQRYLFLFKNTYMDTK